MPARPAQQPNRFSGRGTRYRPVTMATVVGLGSLALPAIGLLSLQSHGRGLWPFAYTCCISLATFIAYGYDKMQARNAMWRVKENTLHLMELAGGWPGALIGQHFFQHKTRKFSYQVCFWIIVAGWQLVWLKVCHGSLDFTDMV